MMKPGVLATTLLSLAIAGLAQDKPVKMADLPAPVQKTVRAELAQGATLRGLLTSHEGGQLEYEAELTLNGLNRDLSLSASGKILEAEDTVTLASLPAAARSALTRVGKIIKVEAVSDHGHFVAYEAKVRGANGKITEIRVDRQGHAVADNG